MIENVRLTPAERQKLINIKKDTGISNWNVICRWALSMSLAQSDFPPAISNGNRGAIEMTWQTFGGEEAAIYEALIEFDHQDSGSTSTKAEWLYRHLNRGINLVASHLKDRKAPGGRTAIEDLVSLAS